MKRNSEPGYSELDLMLLREGFKIFGSVPHSFRNVPTRLDANDLTNPSIWRL